MHLLTPLLFATLGAAQLKDHIFGILKQTPTNPAQFVVAPFCSIGDSLTLVPGLASPSQSFNLRADGALVSSADASGNVATAVQVVDPDGRLVFGPVEEADTGFSTDEASMTLVYCGGQTSFCALNGNIYVNSTDPGCESFSLRGIEYFHPAVCGGGQGP